jgi:hypothetical protein
VSSEPQQPRQHEWWIWDGYECCKVCGVIRRRDDKNSPCKGPVPVGPRKPVDYGWTAN